MANSLISDRAWNRAGLGTPERLRRFSILTTIVFGVLFDATVLIVFTRYRVAVPDDPYGMILWPSLFALSAVPLIVVVQGYRVLRRAQASDEALRVFARATTTLTMAGFLGMGWVFRLVLTAVEHVAR
jgi:hypothetical protein